MTKPAATKPVIIVDSREQAPWQFDDFETVRAKLEFGDYALKGCEAAFAIERKSFADFCHTVTVDADRFRRERERAAAVGAELLVLVEGNLPSVRLRGYPGSVHPEAILGAVCSLYEAGAAPLFAGDRETAQRLARRMLIRRWERAKKTAAETCALVPDT